MQPQFGHIICPTTKHKQTIFQSIYMYWWIRISQQATRERLYSCGSLGMDKVVSVRVLGNGLVTGDLIGSMGRVIVSEWGELLRHCLRVFWLGSLAFDSDEGCLVGFCGIRA
jgi:hypothetical protein